MSEDNLASDMCRCHDSGCSDANNCLRFIRRKDDGPNIVHAASLFPYDIPIGDPCPMLIKP